jgi:tripartite ATP-independent transporter DctP family solute receptor
MPGRFSIKKNDDGRRNAMKRCRVQAAALATSLYIATVCCPFAVTAASAGPILMKLGTPTLNDGQHEFLKRLATAVEKDSAGRIKVEVYPASQLGPIPREIEAVQLGAVQGFISPAEFLEGIDPRFQVLSAPGLFKDMNSVGRAVKDLEFRQEYFKVGAKRGLRVSAVFLSGPTALNSRTPVRHIEDLKGMKIRVMASAMQMDPLKQLGATPVPISLGDVLPALQQGAIDGVLSVLPVLAAMHYYDAAKYITETNLSFAVSTFVISKTWYDQLPPDLQKVIADDSVRIGDEMHQWVVDFYNVKKKAWSDAGGQVLTISSAERASAMASLVPVANRVAVAKPDVKALYDVLERAVKRTQ